MKKPKLFFCAEMDDEICFSLGFFKEKLLEENLESLSLTESVPLYGDGAFYCKIFNVAGSTSDGDCGKNCEKYEPRNKKNGRCRFSGYCYTTGSRKFKLTKDGLEETV